MFHYMGSDRLHQGGSRKRLLLVSLGIISLALVACSDDSEPMVPAIDIPLSVPPINPPRIFAGALAQKDEASVVRFIKNGLYSQTLNDYLPVPSAPSASEADSSSGGQFSTTNTQEVGVDEADRIEFDGEYFYTADFPVWLPDAEVNAKVRILARQSDNSLSQIASLALDTATSSIHGLYLAAADSSGNDMGGAKQLAIISGSEPVYAINNVSSSIYYPNNSDIAFSIEVFDVTHPENLEANSADKINIDGRLINSRRIGNHLYILSAHMPIVGGLDSGASDAEIQLVNYQKIIAAANDTLLPEVRLNGVVQTLVSLEDCFIPEQATAADGNAQMIQVLKIDLSAVQNMQAICIVAATDFIYASSNALYMGGAADNSTFLHKVSLNSEVSGSAGGIQYEASGSVSGIVGWRSQAQLRLSEYENRLRIVTSDYSSAENDPLHRLFVLEQQGKTLNIAGQLPNETYPEPIGKPREDIYAVRYVANKAYVVTFETIDPLYVIDLSVPSLPALQGALEIPGFSSYLQPFGDDLLLGIGQQVNFGDIPNSGEFAPPPFPTQELKVSLFDVRDPMNPIEIGNITQAESYTPVEFDYRALSVLQVGNLTTFGLPVETWRQHDGGYGSANSLMLIDVEESLSSVTLTERLSLTPRTVSNSYIYAGEDRSVLTLNGVYYLRGNEIWFHSGTAGEEMRGPY